MAGFLDFIENNPNAWRMAASIIPGMIAPSRKPYDDSGFQQLRETGALQNQFAADNAGRYQQAAVDFKGRADRAGSPQAMREAEDRNLANFYAQQATQQGALKRTMAGVNPNSGAYGAAQGALRAGAGTGAVRALSTGRMEQQKYGDALGPQAAALFKPDWGGNSAINAGAVGSLAASRYENADRSAGIGNAANALMAPFRDMQTEKREAADRAERQRNQEILMSRFPTAAAKSPEYDWHTPYASNSDDNFGMWRA